MRFQEEEFIVQLFHEGPQICVRLCLLKLSLKGLCRVRIQNPFWERTQRGLDLGLSEKAPGWIVANKFCRTILAPVWIMKKKKEKEEEKKKKKEEGKTDGKNEETMH